MKERITQGCAECDKAMETWAIWHRDMERRAQRTQQPQSLKNQPSIRCSRHRNAEQWHGSSRGIPGQPFFRRR